MKVKNLANTSEKTCKCGSWLKHWQKHHPGSGIDFFCSAAGCFALELVGAHVRKVKSTDKKHYIIPLCKKHNSIGTEVEVKIVAYTTLVSANRSKTCERK